MNRRRPGWNWLILLLLAGGVAGICGCRSCGFYAQAFKGQYQILAHEQRVQTLLMASNTPARLKERLELVESLRSFAAQELKLPVDGHYLKYVDLHRPYVVWCVEAAPEFSLAPKSWWYPLVGRLTYRGYFSERGATNYAASLRAKHFDVFVGGVPAYSTLGWLKDPVLNTFLFDPEPDLAETLFHELGHQRLFASGDTDFDEAFATTVGQEGARRWLQTKRAPADRDRYAAQLQRSTQFTRLVMGARERLAELYGDQKQPDGTLRAASKPPARSPDDMRREKERILGQLREDYAQLKAAWGGCAEYDGWFARPINNAQLNSVATYYHLVPGFERLLELNGGDMEKFYQAAQRLAKEPKATRHQRLKTLAQGRNRGGDVSSTSRPHNPLAGNHKPACRGDGTSTGRPPRAQTCNDPTARREALRDLAAAAHQQKRAA